MKETHISFHAPTGILSVNKGHMHVHGSVEEVSAFASTLIRAVRDATKTDCPGAVAASAPAKPAAHASAAGLWPADFIHELFAMDI